MSDEVLAAIVTSGIGGIFSVIVALLGIFLSRGRPQYILVPGVAELTDQTSGGIALRTIPADSPAALQPETAAKLDAFESSARYAGFWLRSLAFAIDQMLLFTAGFALGVIVSILAAAFGAQDEGLVILVVQGFAAFASISYFGVGWGIWGRTIGSAALRLRVLRQDFRTISLPRAFVRSILVLLSIYTIVGVVLVGITRKKRGLADYLADTIVIKT